jgi:hypothetical protein
MPLKIARADATDLNPGIELFQQERRIVDCLAVDCSMVHRTLLLAIIVSRGSGANSKYTNISAAFSVIAAALSLWFYSSWQGRTRQYRQVETEFATEPSRAEPLLDRCKPGTRTGECDAQVAGRRADAPEAGDAHEQPQVIDVDGSAFKISLKLILI